MTEDAGGVERPRAERVTRALNWVGAYALVLALASGLGALTRLGPGNAVFLAGAACIFGSIAFIRIGGDKTLVGRTMMGAPKWGRDPERRREEIGLGIKLLALGLALWAALPLTLL